MAKIEDNPPTDQKRRFEPSQANPGKLSVFKALGPGLVTGAADDDPSGIATYSQVGAQFGFGLLWVMLFSYPLMGAIQDISARFGRVTGKGIAANMRGHYPAWLVNGTVFLMLAANVVNLGADIGAMGSATVLLVKGPMLAFAVAFGALSILLIVFVPYSKYVFYLKWLTLALFAYVATAFVVHVPWKTVGLSTLSPTLRLNKDYLTSIVAVLGTTISPYLFFWEASMEVEEQKKNPGEEPLKKAPSQAAYQIPRIRLDNYIGMGFSNLIGWFIILTVAATLHAAGKTSVQTSAQAAEALRPIAGNFAFLLFALGIIGTGLLAVPVLAGSAAYAVGEALHWPVGLERAPLQAKGFYAVLTVATVTGTAMNFLHVDPIKALFWSAVLNGIVAGPIMIVMMLMGHNKRILGEFTLSPRLRFMGWLATAVMLAATVGFFATSL